MDNASSALDDNPFAAPKQQSQGWVIVKLPTDDWLCEKMDKLNITLVEGYRSRRSEAGGLQNDQFVKVGTLLSKWYGFHLSTDKPSGSVSLWGSESVKLNSSYSRVARSSVLSSPLPASRPISQNILSRWLGSRIYICMQPGCQLQ